MRFSSSNYSAYGVRNVKQANGITQWISVTNATNSQVLLLSVEFGEECLPIGRRAEGRLKEDPIKHFELSGFSSPTFLFPPRYRLLFLFFKVLFFWKPLSDDFRMELEVKPFEQKKRYNFWKEEVKIPERTVRKVLVNWSCRLLQPLKSRAAFKRFYRSSLTWKLC